jgi:hypothetical protein
MSGKEKDKESKDKRESQRIHATRRALKRYKLTFSKKIRNSFIRRIQENEDVVHLESRSKRVSVFAIRHENRWVPVVYDNKRKEIVTFLPKEWLKDHQGKLLRKDNQNPDQKIKPR